MNILKILEERFNESKYINDVEFSSVLPLLNNEILDKVSWMEERKGLPEIVKYKDDLLIVEMSNETPSDRSVCYDMDARVNRKKFPPETSAMEISISKGLELVDEELYNYLQTLKDLDTKTSSWLKTGDLFRKKGGALTGEKRYGRTFIYHNGADSYYSSRSFRTYLILNK